VTGLYLCSDRTLARHVRLVALLVAEKAEQGLDAGPDLVRCPITWYRGGTAHGGDRTQESRHDQTCKGALGPC
jgi:hypothetical protein